MELYHGKTVEHWKNNAEEDYYTTPISVLKYITVLEEQVKQMLQEQRKATTHKPFVDEWNTSDWRDTGEMGG